MPSVVSAWTELQRLYFLAPPWAPLPASRTWQSAQDSNAVSLATLILAPVFFNKYDDHAAALHDVHVVE
jgi:hypothetical protein